MSRKTNTFYGAPLMWVPLLALVLLATVLIRSGAGEPKPEPTPTPVPTTAPTPTPEPEYLEYGTDTSLEIDDSGFLHPETKNNLDLVSFVTEAWKHQWGYVWGFFGDVLTEESLQFRLEMYPDDITEYEDIIREKWMGRRAADCMGLIKAYGWYHPDQDVILYNTNDIPDYGTDTLFKEAEEIGPIRTIPEIPGLLVYRDGHVGVYIGGGYVIEAHGSEYGVVKTRLDQQPFTHWLKCPFIEYIEE